MRSFLPLTLFARTRSVGFALGAAAAIALGAPALAASPAAGPAKAPAAAASGAQDFSPAEKLLFLGDDLSSLKLPAKVDYRFRHGGTLDAAFDDPVRIDVIKTPAGACCAASVSFLSDKRQIPLPAVDDAKANPVILYVLEREVRELKRITGGTENYFRKRMRMAIYQDAQVRPVTLAYRGQNVPVQEVRFSPYRDDPNRLRFEKHIARQYAFYLSPKVPGGVYGFRAVTPGAAASDAPLVTDTLVIDGGDAAAMESLAGVPQPVPPLPGMRPAPAASAGASAAFPSVKPAAIPATPAR